MYRLLAENVTDVVLTSDLDLKLTYVSPSISKLSGFTPEEALSMPLDELLCSDFVSDANRMISEHSSPESHATGIKTEFDIRRKDGGTSRAEIAASLLYDEAGQTTGILTVARDITQQRKAEKSLAESEALFRGIVDAMPLGIHLYRLDDDDQLIFVGANPTADAILGLDSSGDIGKTIEDCFSPLAATSTPAAYRKVALDGEPWHSGHVDYHDSRMQGTHDVHAFQTAPGRIAVVFEDVTARRKSEDALREGEQRFRAFVEQASEGVVLTDEVGNVVIWNQAMEELTGLLPDRALGRPLWDVQLDITPPDLRTPSTAESLQEAVLAGLATEASPLASSAQEIAICTPDGTHRTISRTTFAISTDKGRLIGCLATNVTHRREAEKREEKHRRDLAFLVDTAMAFVEWQDGDIHQFAADMIAEVVGGDAVVAVCECDAETGHFRLKELLGVSSYREQLTKLLGTNPHELKADFSPAVVELISKGRMLKVDGGIGALSPDDISMPVASAISKIMNAGETYVIGFVLEREIYGCVVVIARKDAPVPDHGIIEAFAGQASVAFARKKAEKGLRLSEQRYRSLFENAHIGIVRVDVETKKIVEANDYMARTLGMRGAAELLGADPTGFIPKDFGSLPQEHARRVASDEVEIVCRDGDTIWLQSMAWLAPDGATIECVAVDVTEARRAQEEARAREEQLVEADKLKSLGTLIAGVAHEINNPNSFVSMNIPLLERMWKGILELVEDRLAIPDDHSIGGLSWEMMKERTPKLLGGIRDGSARIRNIVSGLKNYARHSPGTHNHDIDLNEVVEAAAALTRSRIIKSTNSFLVELDYDLPKMKGNFQRLEQVIINLLMNACEAIRTREQAVTVKTRYIAEGQILEAVVSDEGVGIPEENLRQIRDPFFTTRREAGGSGLGLSISVSIVEEHGGMLLIDSTPGRGTRAIVRLPRKGMQV
jgi:PAS domain S-box-containing protein